MDSLDLYLDGQAGEIDVTAFAEVLLETAKLLRSVSDEGIDCTISNLEIGSVKAAVLAPESAVNSVVTGLHHINTVGTLPQDWSNRSLAIVERIGKTMHRPGIVGVSMGKGNNLIRIEGEFLKRVNKAKIASRQAFGSVEGRLYSYTNRHGEVRASIEETKTKRTVKLILASELANQASKLINTDVIAFGSLTRRPEDNTVQEIEVTQIQPQVAKRLPSDISKFRGILEADWPKDLDPVEAVRLHRGA